MKSLLPALAASLVLATAVFAADDSGTDRGALQGLHGTFQSPAIEQWYGGYGTRELVFADGHWSLTFIHALDPAMTQRTFQFRTGGGYTVEEPSSSVPGAFHTVFQEEWKHLTLLTSVPEVAAAMGVAGCGLTVNLEADISKTGCAAWRPVADCGEDHDLLALTKAGLHFGERPADNDMCTPARTPTTLLPPVVRR